MDEGVVSVDKFSGGCQAYFLTHLHQDHTRGLGVAGGWRHGPLYCSPTTACLLRIRFPGIDASLLRPLARGASASISISSASSGQSLSLRVTAIPAIHCPGSLMYLFHGDPDTMRCVLRLAGPLAGPPTVSISRVRRSSCSLQRARRCCSSMVKKEEGPDPSFLLLFASILKFQIQFVMC